MPLESQLELCQNLRQFAAIEAVKGLRFSFNPPLLSIFAFKNSSLGHLVTQSLRQRGQDSKDQKDIDIVAK